VGVRPIAPGIGLAHHEKTVLAKLTVTVRSEGELGVVVVRFADAPEHSGVTSGGREIVGDQSAQAET
jgi:hypothetical protein